MRQIDLGQKTVGDGSPLCLLQGSKEKLLGPFIVFVKISLENGQISIFSPGEENKLFHC